MRKNLFFVVVSISMFTTLKAQNKVVLTLDQYFVQWQKGEPVASTVETLMQFDHSDVLSELERCTSDSTAIKRYGAYQLIGQIGPKMTKPALRKRAVKQLVFGCNDRDGGIVGANLKSVTEFPASDFDPEIRYMLSEMAKKPASHYEQLIKICGWLGITELSYNFRQMIAEKKGNTRQRWAMRLAMARMNEADMVDYCLQKVKSIPVNDNVVYDLVPDIIYTRQKLLFDYLLGIIESDAKKCSSPNPDSNAKIICAYRVMEQIAPYIQNFPIETDASGDLTAQNYEKALARVREWIKLNKENFTIQKERF